MSQHEAGVMSQLRTMIERPPYWDLLVVCRDGSLQSVDSTFNVDNISNLL